VLVKILKSAEPGAWYRDLVSCNKAANHFERQSDGN
jgi:hypothetical protein